MASQADDDLTASKTEGYKAGEKKTVEEYAKLGMSWIFRFRFWDITIHYHPNLSSQLRLTC